MPPVAFRRGRISMRTVHSMSPESDFRFAICDLRLAIGDWRLEEPTNANSEIERRKHECRRLETENEEVCPARDQSGRSAAKFAGRQDDRKSTRQVRDISRSKLSFFVSCPIQGGIRLQTRDGHRRG